MEPDATSRFGSSPAWLAHVAEVKVKPCCSRRCLRADMLQVCFRSEAPVRRTGAIRSRQERGGLNEGPLSGRAIWPGDDLYGREADLGGTAAPEPQAERRLPSEQSGEALIAASPRGNALSRPELSGVF